MGKRRKRKSPPLVDDAPTRHCPHCDTRIVLDRQGRHWLMVWAYRKLAGPPCCDGSAVPADHWHADCQQCGARWTEHDATRVDTLSNPEEPLDA